jgi:hypothetical protein
MCTVTIVPYSDGFRLVSNRDERLDRPAAAAPTVHQLPCTTAIYPVDPVGGGTWIGVNEAGLAAALLNRTIDSAAARDCMPPRSRGLIIPHLLGCRSLIEALEIAEGLDPAQFDLFRVVLVQRMAAVVLISDGITLSFETIGLSRPLMLTSSSLGDAVVEVPRRRLFERLVSKKKKGAWVAAQTRFHAHRWRSRGDISVTMQLPATRTVSRTCIAVTSRATYIRYDPLGSAKRQQLQWISSP